MLAVALVLLVGDPRLVVAPDAEVAVGYDDNLFLNPELVGAIGGPIGDAILHVAPRIPVALVTHGGHSLTLTYDLVWHEPLSGSFGTIADQLFTLEYRTPEIDTPAAPLVLRVQGLAERYDATFTSVGTTFNYDAFWLGGVEAGAQLVGRTGRGAVGYRYSVRGYSNRDEQDREHRIFASYEARPVPHLSAGASYTFTYVGSTAGGMADFLDGADRHRFALPIYARGADLSLRIEPSLTVQTLPDFTPLVRHDKIFGLTAAGTVRVSELVDLFLRYDLLRASSDDETPTMPGTGSFTRDQVVFGIIGHFSYATAPPPLATAAPEAAQAPERPLAPRRQPDGSTRFRLAAPGASAVAIAGEWNQWQPEPLSAAPEGGDLWQVDLTLPTGRYAYSFVVDGETVRPPDAEAYVSDGFGGVNGVIEVAP